MVVPTNDLLTLRPDTIIDLYILDLAPLGVNEQYRFCNWKDSDGLDIKFQGHTYIALPLRAEGFEINSRGQMPSPKMEFSNVLGLISALAAAYDDLVRAKLIRKRTLARFLDGRPTSNPSVQFDDDVYYVRRKEQESELTISFELKRSLDMGISSKLPSRYMLKSLCPWQYRSAECGYTGGAVADENDAPTEDINRDRCGKRIKSCKLRFGEYGELNYGGFPGLDEF